MCKFGGSGGLFGNGGLGGLLGGLAGGALDFAFPELGVPLALATGGGSFIGNLAGGGDLKGAALEGLTAGAAGGLGEAATGGSFFAAPGGSGISGLFSGGAGAAGDVAGPAGAIGPAGEAGAITSAALPAATSSLPSTAAAVAPTDLTAGLTTGASSPAVTGTSVGTAAGVPSTTTDAATAATEFGGGGDFANASLGSKIMSYIKNNPLSLLTAGAAAVPLLQGNTVPGLSDLKNQATLQATQGNQQAAALTTGQLPQGAQATLDNNAQAARAAVRNEYGKMGLTGSTLEADKLAAIDQDQASQKFAMLKGVTDSGLAAIGNSDKLLETIMNTEISQDKATADSIARLVAALAGGGATATKAAA